MQRDQRDQTARQHEHVDRVEAWQRVAVDRGASLQELRDERAEERRRRVDVDADRRRPVRRLVPRQQVAGEALGETQHEQEHADEPVQLPRVLVGAEEEDAPHVQEHQDDEARGAPAVHAAHEPAGPEIVGDVLDRGVGLVGGRLVVHRQDHAGRRLDDEGGQRRRAERLEPVDVGRDVAEEEVADRADDARPLLEPVDRIEDPLAGGGRRRGGHQLGGWIGYSQDWGPSTCTPGKRLVPLVDPRGRAGAVDARRPRRGCRGTGRRCTTENGSGRARGRAGRRCGCPRCRTARRGTGSRSSTAASSIVTSPTFFSAGHGRRPVRLHRAAEVDAVVREDREARLGLRLRVLDDAVVADEDT